MPYMRTAFIAMGLACLTAPSSAFILSNPRVSLRSGSSVATNSALPTARFGRANRGAVLAPRMASTEEYKTQLIGAKQAVAEVLDKTNANPIMVCFC